VQVVETLLKEATLFFLALHQQVAVMVMAALEVVVVVHGGEAAVQVVHHLLDKVITGVAVLVLMAVQAAVDQEALAAEIVA
tara:strand:- start:168 stop:410 length:243 start_codon:yes stop_codon:yes gene_type:complete